MLTVIQNRTNRLRIPAVCLPDGVYDFSLVFSICTSDGSERTFEIEGEVCNCTLSMDIVHECDNNDAFNLDIDQYRLKLYLSTNLLGEYILTVYT